MLDYLQSLSFSLWRNFSGNLDLVILFASYYLFFRLVRSRATDDGLSSEAVSDVIYWAGVGALVGGRLAYVLPNASLYVSHPRNLLLINNGMYFYGAVVGALIVGGLMAWRKKLPFWKLADAFGLYAPLAIAITRFGCLTDNTCFGRLAPTPLGIVFPGLTQPRYPSELYEALLALMLFGVLLWISQRNLTRGTMFLLFLGGYAAIRSLTDLTRFQLGGEMGLVEIALSLSLTVSVAALLVLRRYLANNAESTVRDTS